ncbi:MAG: cation:proton antiporter [Proteiniphilum sp.]|jgi:Kef-type K+ transport system membrane component KefB|uniref:cation:proton antiporter n=1 Tax=Proteiniphilum sp. TaxID=1926877 RepID=UPI002B2196D3|nr:cation:proton antiporter [Proteiniphilum sp.]MEA5128833.1 cation:proton antiporter [Proteiniphilum sp.]
MKHFRNIIFYVAVIGSFSLLMYWIVLKGSIKEVGRNIAEVTNNISHWQEFLDAFSHNLQHPLAILLLQIVVIILVARLFGWICKKIGQPTVIGEIIAGIALGPSLLGLYFPEISVFVFPDASLGNIQVLSQIGLVLFMFVVGMEIDLGVLKSKAHDAVVISHASIILPFALGMGLAYFIYEHFAPEGVHFSSFGLFLGIAMSITAFPVLARIVQERGINKTRLGTVVITCAAADDITAWCLLAVVIAIVKAGSFISALYTIVLAVLYVFLMIKIVRPFLKRIGDLHSSPENLSKPIVALFFLTIIFSAYMTEVIGIHALFGAFMAGAIMPENPKFRHLFIEKVEDIALVLLLPLFFVYTGLRTQIGLLNEPYLWGVTVLIIVVAVIGKFIGSALAAKFVGQSWKNSLVIGALMNTRGLMELVVLNIGYDLGVLNAEIFAMMVIMALVTTFMTGPALDLFDRIFKTKKQGQSERMIPDTYRILLSFGRPEGGKSLLQVANVFSEGKSESTEVTALHLSPGGELHHFNEDQIEQESFEPITEESVKLQQKFTPFFKISNEIDADIIDTANKGDYHLLLIGEGESIFEGSLLGKMIRSGRNIFNFTTNAKKMKDYSLFDERIRNILMKTKIPVGIFINRRFEKADRILIPIYSSKDIFLLRYAEKGVANATINIVILDVKDTIKNDSEFQDEIIRLQQRTAPDRVSLIQSGSLYDMVFMQQFDLMFISTDGWYQMEKTGEAALISTLIIKK